MERIIKAAEFIKDLATAPIRNFRAEKLRKQQAEALAVRNDLALKDIHEISHLMRTTKDPYARYSLACTLRRVVDTKVI